MAIKRYCCFCSERLKYGNSSETVIQSGTGWRFHYWCLQKVNEMRSRQKHTPPEDMQQKLSYIRICVNGVRNVLVYQ
jgi:hypothetical protein